MMYNSKFVVSVKSASGQVLRELGDKVFLPFGSEYSIFLKNLNTRRALVTVEIDGKDVLNGSQLVVVGNSSIDLERFITRSSSNQGNRFKFIERTRQVEKARGIGAEDGIVRVTFAYERDYVNTWLTDKRTYLDPNYIRPGDHSGWYGQRTPSRGLFNSVLGTSVNCHSTYSAVSTNYSSEAGITVPGSVSNQKFTETSGFTTDTKEVIVLRLFGETSEATPVIQPITVKHKQTCVTCQKINKMSAKFCSECGTALVIL